ncbi:MAG: PAS domain S-box protein [Planctomycetota bacterium]|nr:PAS domain S-box protein [Planctomycetota bacterium]
MTEQSIATLAATSAAVILIAACIRFYQRERRREVAFWCIGWTLYLLRLLVEPLLNAPGTPTWEFKVAQWAFLAGSTTVLWGTLTWLGRATRAKAWVLAAAMTASALAAALDIGAGASVYWLDLPVWIYSGSVFLWTGFARLTSPNLSGVGKFAPAAMFVAWGLFNFLTPRHRPTNANDVIQFVGASLLGMMASAGLLLAYLDRQRLDSDATHELLRQSQERSWLMFENSADAAYLVDMRGIIREINHMGYQKLGYERSELVGQHIASVSAHGDAEGFVKFLNSIEFGKPVIGTNLALRKDGSTLPMEVHIVLLMVGGERLALGVARDVSLRMRAEEARRQSEERLRAILDHHFQLTGLLDPQGRVVVVNRAALSLAKTTADQVVGKHISETPWWKLSPDFQEQTARQLPAAQRGEFVRFEAKFGDGKGGLRHLDVSFSPIRNEAGEVTYIVPEGRDITDLRRAQEELRRAQSERALILDTMQELVVHYDPDARIVWANRAAARAAGVEPGTLVGLPCAGLWHHARESAPDSPLSMVRSTGRHHESQIRGGDGRTWHVRAYPLHDAAGIVTGVVEFSQDVTLRLKMQDALRDSEIKYRSYINYAPSAIFVTDDAGRVVDVNPAGCALTGYTPSELMTMRLTDLMAVPGPPGGAGVSARGAALPMTFDRGSFRRKDGSRRWWTMSSSLLHDGKRISFARDVTEMVEAERQLRLTQFAVDRTNDEVFWIAADGRIIYANDAAAAATGYPSAELVAMHVWDLLDGVHRDGWPRFWAGLQEKRTVHFEATHRVREAEGFTVEIVANVLEFEGQTYACAFLRDITARHKAQQALRESESRYRLLADNIGDIIWARGPDLERLAYVSPSVIGVMGYTPEEMLGFRLEDYMPPASAAAARRHLAQIRKAELDGTPDNMTHCIEVEWRRKDGSTAWVETTTRPLRGPGGELVGVVGVTRNLADRRRSEQELRASEARYRTLVENIPQRIFMKDRESRYVSVNASYARDLGRPPEQVIGREDFEFYPRALAEKYRADDRTVMNSGLAMECDEDYIDSGQKRTIHTIKTPVKDEAGRVIGVLGVFSDITERRKTQEDLRRSEERYRTLFESAIDGIVLANAQTGELIDCNQAMADMVGRTRAELIGQSHAILHPPAETGAAGFSAIFEQNLGGKPGQIISARLLTRDGRLRDVAAKGHLITLEGRSVVQAIFRDNTEANRLEEQLRQAQKMEVIGQLAGGIAHDFRNQLTVVRGYAELLEKAPTLPRDGRDMVAEILKAVHRSTDMTGRLLALGRKQRLEPRRVNLMEALSDLAKSLPRLVGEDVHVRVIHRDSRCVANVDPIQFQQAVINMVVNARHAMPRGGELDIETQVLEILPDAAARHPDLRPGEYAVVSVTDTGTGIKKEDLAHIFEPFFTTKGVGVGTGLGLAITYGFVKQSGGAIEVQSEAGRGTTFRIYFPAVAEPAEAPPRQAAVMPTARGDGSLLLVEDEPSVRDVVARVLREAGYRLMEAGSASEALELAAEPGFAIDVLVTDVVMPGLSGPELARRMSRMIPGLKVLFITGYPGRQLEPHGVADLSESAVLSKPFSAAELVAAVARAREVAVEEAGDPEGGGAGPNDTGANDTDPADVGPTSVA